MTSEKRRKPMDESCRIRQQLERMCRFGVKLYIEGNSSTATEVAKQCIREECLYMGDYVMDDYGKLIEIRYEKVKNK